MILKYTNTEHAHVSYNFRECQKMLDKRNWKDADEKLHFESGVRLGVGLFNLVRYVYTKFILVL